MINCCHSIQIFTHCIYVMKNDNSIKSVLITVVDSDTSDSHSTVHNESFVDEKILFRISGTDKFVEKAISQGGFYYNGILIPVHSVNRDNMVIFKDKIIEI